MYLINLNIFCIASFARKKSQTEGPPLLQCRKICKHYMSKKGLGLRHIKADPPPSPPQPSPLCFRLLSGIHSLLLCLIHMFANLKECILNNWGWFSFNFVTSHDLKYHLPLFPLHFKRYILFFTFQVKLFHSRKWI